MKQVTQSDRLVAADRLGLPIYNPRLVPALLRYIHIRKDYVAITRLERGNTFNNAYTEALYLKGVSHDTDTNED